MLLQSDDSYVRAIGSTIKERLDKVIERKTPCFKRGQNATFGKKNKEND